MLKTIKKTVNSFFGVDILAKEVEDLRKELTSTCRKMAQYEKKAGLSEGVHKRLRKVEDLESNHSRAIATILNRINL